MFESAERLGGVGDGGPDRGVVGHVREDRVEVGALLGGLEPFVPVQHGDPGAASGQQPGRGQSDA